MNNQRVKYFDFILCGFFFCLCYLDFHCEAEFNLKAENQKRISTSKKKIPLHIQSYDLSGKHASGRKGQEEGLPTSSGLPCTGHLPDILPKESVASQSALGTICLRITWPQVS